MAFKKLSRIFCNCRRNQVERTSNAATSVRVEGIHEVTLPAYKVLIRLDKREWFIFRRYSEFQILLEVLNTQAAGHKVVLPDQVLLGDDQAVEKGRDALDTFVQQLLADQKLLDIAEVKEFLQLDRFAKDDTDSVFTLSSSNNTINTVITINKPVEDTNSSNNSINTVSHKDSNNNISNSNGNLLSVNLGPSENKQVKPSDFEFLRVIGKGSFGKVVLAKHRKESKYYAVKVLSKSQVLKRDEAKHIMSERNVLLKNLNFPFLVGLHYSFQTPDKLYFVLDYVNGGELFFHLQRERWFQEPRARFYAAEMSAALGYLHANGIIYRDLKPENLLLDSQGHIVLTDFGLSKEGLLFDEKTNTFCGTPEYLAPEVLRKEGYDNAVDWWCLGAVLYEMLYGLPPFYSRNTSEMYDRILYKPVKLKPSISEEARDILQKLLHKDRLKRLGAGFAGYENIKRHIFFRPINWEDLIAKRIEPPFNPKVTDVMDLHNIDPEFTREAVPFSVGRSAQSSMLTASVQQANGAFAGFSYAPPLT